MHGKMFVSECNFSKEINNPSGIQTFFIHIQPLVNVKLLKIDNYKKLDKNQNKHRLKFYASMKIGKIFCPKHAL